MNTKFKLGRSIAQIVPFYRQRQPEQQQQKETITTKLVITMVRIAIVKIAVLMLWILQAKMLVIDSKIPNTYQKISDRLISEG